MSLNKVMNDRELLDLNLYVHYGLDPTLSELQSFQAAFEQRLTFVIIDDLHDKMDEGDFERYIQYLSDEAPEKALAFAQSRGFDLPAISLQWGMEIKERILEQHTAFSSVDALHDAMKFSLPPVASMVYYPVVETAVDKLQNELKRHGYVADENRLDAFREVLFKRALVSAVKKATPDVISRLSGPIAELDLDKIASVAWELQIDLAELIEAEREGVITDFVRELSSTMSQITALQAEAKIALESGDSARISDFLEKALREIAN